jgi:hypothetical protein
MLHELIVFFFIFLETNTLIDDQDVYQVCTHIEFYYNVYIKLYTVSVIGGENWSTRRKPLTCHKSLTNFIT